MRMHNFVEIKDLKIDILHKLTQLGDCLVVPFLTITKVIFRKYDHAGTRKMLLKATTCTTSTPR